MQTDRRLLGAFLASLALHAAAGVGAAFIGISRGATSAVRAVDPDQMPIEIAIGILESDNITKTWLGFPEPSEHDAPLSRVEQPQFTLAPESLPSPPMMPLPVGEEPHEAERREATPRIDLAELATSLPPSAGGEVADVLPPSVHVDLALLPERERPAQEPARKVPIEPTPEPPKAAPMASVAKPDSRGAEERGSDDRQSAPSDTDIPLQVKPGKTAAAEGLEIATKIPPRFTIPAEIFSARMKPLFAITFGRDGTVKRVEIVRSSGRTDVDEPWRAALYRWTAKGKALDDLPADDPEASITIRIELLPP